MDVIDKDEKRQTLKGYSSLFSHTPDLLRLLRLLLAVGLDPGTEGDGAAQLCNNALSDLDGILYLTGIAWAAPGGDHPALPHQPAVGRHDISKY